LKILVKRIEEDCATVLKNWKGNVSEIREKIIPIVEEVFKVSRLPELEKQKIGETQKAPQNKNESLTKEATPDKITNTKDQTKESDTNVNPQSLPEKETQAQNDEIRL
jgi:hypothetical protein